MTGHCWCSTCCCAVGRVPVCTGRPRSGRRLAEAANLAAGPDHPRGRNCGARLSRDRTAAARELSRNSGVGGVVAVVAPPGEPIRPVFRPFRRNARPTGRCKQGSWGLAKATRVRNEGFSGHGSAPERRVPQWSGPRTGGQACDGPSRSAAPAIVPSKDSEPSRERFLPHVAPEVRGPLWAGRVRPEAGHRQRRRRNWPVPAQ
jgi:hypothetical protein